MHGGEPRTKMKMKKKREMRELLNERNIGSLLGLKVWKNMEGALLKSKGPIYKCEVNKIFLFVWIY